MLRHLLKLAWRRRRVHSLLAIEIAASFLVVAALASVGTQFALNARRPLGFDGRDVWIANVEPLGSDSDDWSDEEAATMRQVLAEARAFDGVEEAAGATNVPYDFSERNWQFRTEGGIVDAEFNVVTADYRDVFRITVVEGRWFDETDRGTTVRPVVVDRELARALSPNDSALGKVLPRDEGETEMRVVGVIDDFRESGELSGPRPYFFALKAEEKGGGSPVRTFALRMSPDAPASLEPALLARLRAVAPTWQFEIRTVDSMRTRTLNSMLGPLAAAGVVAVFLVAMVALGLTGVLWQNVTRRTQEFALRRAVGATASQVRALVLGELAVVAALAILAAALVAAQVPMLGLFPTLQPWSLALALAASAAFVLAVVTICGLYPSALAMRAAPAEALRYE